MNSTKSTDVTIRDFLPEDIIPMVKYWTQSSAEFWKVRGVAKDKLNTEGEFTERYKNAFLNNGGVKTIAVIQFFGKAIGVHSLTDLIENESAVFHAHIWDEENRKRGIGFYSYLKAAEYFMYKLNLKKIIFKTPIINIGANRIKKKLGIPKIGETIFESPILFAPLEANLYELNLELLEKIKKKKFFK